MKSSSIKSDINHIQRTSMAFKMRTMLIAMLLILAFQTCHVNGQGSCSRACYPQFVDLIVDNLPSRSVTTDSQCGNPPSQFELHVSSNLGDTFTTETCNASNPEASYPLEAAYDFTSFVIFGQSFTSPQLTTWWQSENAAANVHLTLNLGDEFLFQQTVISFRSYRPASMIIEKSDDAGLSWTPLRYFAINCASTFPDVLVSSVFSFQADCREEYVFGHSMTEVDGEDIQRLIYNPVQELEQTYFEYEYQRYFSLSGLRITLVTPGRQEPLRNYFAVADWNVQGQCLCYGHASMCMGSNEADCECQHNTAGLHCDSCLPLYNNKPWQAALGSETNACEDCGCSGRADSCVYSEVKGYGVCQDCLENTSGDKCEVCFEDYYRNPYTDPAFNETCIDGQAPYPCIQYCWPCNCTLEGTVPISVCNETNGQCECKTNVQGRACDECMDTFYNLQDSNDQGCQECDCDPTGTSGNINLCDKTTGECICKENVMGTRCDQCKAGTFNLDPADPNGCTPCDCDPGAAISGSCDPNTGACICRSNIVGRACNGTDLGFYVPLLDGISKEGETANTNQPSSIEERSQGEGTLHTGSGFLVVPARTVITLSDVTVPRSQNYVLAVRYETTDSWNDVVTIEINQQNPAEFECQGSTNPGTSSTLVSLPAAGYGGVYQLTEQCLGANVLHDVIITIGVADNDPQAQFLLDSVVFLPVLTDLEVYQSNSTSEIMRENMAACLAASLSAQDPSRVNCSAIEFAIMAEVFDGAIACDCSPLGSDTNPVCASYGGQCPCLPGVAARSCDSCAPFFYGIESGTGCTDCGCSVEGSVTQSCNQTSGICECKQNVEGEKCDACATDHFGLATGNGCVPCDCTADYSLGTSCTDDGQCNCKTGVGGLSCTQCGPGYFNLTTDGCVECACNPMGSVDGNCDSLGQCNCLSSSTGLQCDECPQGTYGFGTYSERGCIECLCSSHTANCSSATGWFVDRLESQYSLLNVEGAVSDRWTGILGDGSELEVVSEPILEISDPRFVLELVDPGNTTDLFFIAPPPYLGDHRTAYGQLLEFTLSQMTSENQTSSTEGDVYIYGTCECEPLVASLPYTPGSPVTNATVYQSKLHESYWNLGNIGGPRPTMKQLVRILADIAEIRIRAKYTTISGQSVFFHDASLTEASNNTSTSNLPADYVEDCSCPPEYTGQFCEQCAAGFRRAAPGNGSFSICVPCDCNEHSNLPCDPETGVCRDCQDNTGGDFCERCLDGYYGNALGGTPGDCIPCLCPGEPGTNSFAATCDSNGLCINCAEGHGGDFCEFCLEGYYGVPGDLDNNGGRCEPCFCSLSPAVCDSTTGQCLKCTGNTDGQECEVCQFGYWGNIDSCQECTCNLTGGYGNCTQDTGVCYCYPSVVGNECTECAPDTWGFDSGLGCTDCDCHPVGTVGQQTQCDLASGQCDCKALVTGQRCDGCSMGYYDVDQECIACNCNVNGTNPTSCSGDLCSCDLVTGQCDCKLRTIAGQTCDRCGRLDQSAMQVVEEIFVGNFPNCEPCPECFQNWGQELEILGELLGGERQRLLGLLGNYGNMTEDDVGMLIGAIRRNLTLATQVIEDGNQQTQTLVNIQNSFLMISESIANKTAILDSISTLEANITSLLSESSDFDGTVEVESGVGRDSERLDQELSAVTNTIDNIATEAEGNWESVQTLYQEVLDFQVQAQQLMSEVDSLARDIEGASQQRITVEDILAEPTRTAETNVNAQRLSLIDSTQASYPLEVAAQNASAAESLVREANLTARSAYQQAVSERTLSEERAYRSEVARFNATGATAAVAKAFSAATNYKDIALATKANITQTYMDTLTQLSQLNDAQTSIQEANAASTATLTMAVRSSTDMQTLVQQINATGLSDAAVVPLLENSTASLEVATASLTTARLSLQEALSVRSQVDNLEYDLAEAERVREVTVQRVTDTQGKVTNISQIATEVQSQSQSKASEAQTTSDLVQDLTAEAISGQECFSAKRAQVQDAGRRVNRAKEDVASTQQELDIVLSGAEDLATSISTAEDEAITSHNLGKEVDAITGVLETDLLSIEDMVSLDDLIAEYTSQRQEMEQLNSDLDRMEASLDAVLANLQGVGNDQIQCNN